MMIRMTEISDEEFQRHADELVKNQLRGSTTVLRLAAEMKATTPDTIERYDAQREVRRAIDRLAQDVPNSSLELTSFALVSSAVDIIMVLTRTLKIDVVAFLSDVETNTERLT